MGVGSLLAKIGGAIAAPFTGGASLALTALGGIGDIAGAAASGRAEGRAAEANQAALRDRLALDRATTARSGQLDLADLDLRQRTTAQDLDKERIRQLILGGLLSGAQDVQIEAPAHIASRMPKITGGLKPSAIAGREDIGNAIRDRLLPQLQKGDQFSLPELEALPELTPTPKSSWVDKALGAIGAVGAGAGAIGNARNASTTPVTTPPYTPTRTGSLFKPQPRLVPPTPMSDGTTTGRISWRG